MANIITTEELEDYFEQYVAPHLLENAIKGLLLPYAPYEELEKIYGKDIASYIKNLR